MKNLILIATINFLLTNCTDRHKIEPEKKIYILPNLTNNDIEIRKFVDNQFSSSLTIQPFEVITDSSFITNEQDSHFNPSYTLGDSIVFIFNNENYIYYNYHINTTTFNYVNDKNILNFNTWQIEDLSTSKLQKYIYTFQITEEDYALAEDL